MNKRRPQVDPTFRKCRECGREWNVSKLALIPLNGYCCPACRQATTSDKRKAGKERTNT